MRSRIESKQELCEDAFDGLEAVDIRICMSDLAGRIREIRKKLGLNQMGFAEQLGVSQGTVSRWEASRNPQKPDTEALHRIASLADLPLEELVSPATGGQKITNKSLQSFSEAVPNFNPPPEILGERDLPVFSAVEGGPGEMVVSTDPIDIVPRPWFIKNVKEAYAVLVVGESMVPVFKPGMMVIVNPKLPLVPGEPAIFVNRQHDDFRATLKELVRASPQFWVVHQWNPPEGQKHEFKLLRKDWPEAYRVVGSYYR